MTITINNQPITLTAEQEKKLKKALGVNDKQLSEVECGKTFTIKDKDWSMEFIKFYDKDGVTFAVAKDIAFDAKFGTNSNFYASNIERRLRTEILPKIEAAVGAENVLEHNVDLLSLDGDDKYGNTNTKISVPTFDFYRHNARVFDKYNPKRTWWLATAYTTDTHWCDNLVCYVRHGGDVGSILCDCYDGVRPFVTFKSSIFVS